MHRDLKVLKSIENRNFIVPRGYKEVNNLLHYFCVLSFVSKNILTFKCHLFCMAAI